MCNNEGKGHKQDNVHFEQHAVSMRIVFTVDNRHIACDVPSD